MGQIIYVFVTLIQGGQALNKHNFIKDLIRFDLINFDGDAVEVFYHVHLLYNTQIVCTLQIIHTSPQCQEVSTEFSEVLLCLA